MVAPPRSAPPLSPPARPHRPGTARRRRRPAPVLLLAVLVLIGLVAVIAHTTKTTSGNGQTYAHPPYAPQFDRTAEWAGPGGGLSDREVNAIAQNAGIEVLPKFTDNFNIQAHFQDARRLAEAAKAVNNPIKIYEYFSASFWFTANETGWGSYAAGFNRDWLLRDASGNPIPFYGVGHRADTGGTPVGYLVDLSNPDYRAWAVRTIVSWMHAAPYAGIMFDSANPLLTGTARASVGAGSGMNFEQLLCGGAGVATLTCPRLDDWNRGLTTLISTTSAALHQIGDDVIYNGIAAGDLRGPTRNLGLLNVADAAANEAFCLSPATSDPGRVNLQPFAPDTALMKAIAGRHKKVLEITNYQSEAKRAYGDYCLAGFLMGWQPGSSYYIFHTSYGDALSDGYPEVPEANLALGQPLSSDYTQAGDLMSRQFANGFVAVNTGTQPAQVRVPVSGVRFANGASHGSLAAGQTVRLAQGESLYVLSNKYLHG